MDFSQFCQGFIFPPKAQPYQITSKRIQWQNATLELNCQAILRIKTQKNEKENDTLPKTLVQGPVEELKN